MFFGATGPSSGAPTFRDRHLMAQRRRTRAGWIALCVALGVALILAFLPAPYVIERPGPSFNTVGSVHQNGGEVSLISITGAATYPTAGALDLVTVSIFGSVQQRPSWLELALSWFDPRSAVKPIESVFPPDVSPAQNSERNAMLMQSSQKDAVAAALTELGY